MKKTTSLLFLASDHAGFSLKEFLKQKLKENGMTFEDLGPRNAERVDYPDFAADLARKIQQNGQALGLLICGTGLGMAMTANKFSGVRAAPVNDLYAARMAREHNDANVLCIGARLAAPELAWEILQEFLKGEFAKGRHEDRLKKIKAIEEKNCRSNC